MELKNEERTRCEIWTRVMGYHRPVSQYNKGKYAEYKQRKYFKETVTINSLKEKEEVSEKDELLCKNFNSD